MFEDLLVPSSSIDVVISNGVLNLAPDKPRVLREIARVLKPGGRLYLADVVVARELKLEVRENPELWAACIGGALSEDELTTLAAAAGLGGGRIIERFDCFAGTAAGDKVASDLDIHGVNFFRREVDLVIRGVPLGATVRLEKSERPLSHRTRISQKRILF